jgi:hypothetical protein
VGIDLAGARRWCQSLESWFGERQTDDRGRFDDRSFRGGQGVEPRREEGVDGRRDGQLGEVGRRNPSGFALDQTSALDEHGQQLLDEERVALRRRHDPAASLVRQARLPEQVLYHPGGVRVREWLEDDPIRPRLLRPVRMLLEELIAGRAEHHQ